MTRNLNLALNGFESSSQEIFSHEGSLVVILRGFGNARLWAMYRPSLSHWKWFENILASLISALYLMVFVGLSFAYMVPEPSKWLSIQTKLIGLIGFATGLPLVILFANGSDYLHEKEASLMNQSYAEMSLVLRGLDNKFLLMQQRYATWLKKFTKKMCGPGGDFSLPTFTKLLSKFQDQMNLPTPMIVQKDGTIILTREKDQLLYQLALRMMMRYNQSLGFPEDEKARKQLKMDALFSSDKQITDLTRDLLHRVGQVCRITFGKLDKYLYIDVVTGPSGIANDMLFFFWKPKELAFQYLRQALLTYQRDLKDSRLFVLRPNDGEKFLPPGSEQIPWLWNFMERLKVRSGLTRDRILWKGTPYLIAGIPGQELEGYFLVQIMPLSRITNPVSELRRKLIILGLVSLSLSLLIGAVLAQQFLRPVGHLSEAVKAIDTGVFDHRIPVLENDELGKLSLTFNGMMEGLEQLSVARAVQSSLFPAQSLETANWHLWGSSHSASELGGDYFDYFALEDGRLVVLIGDVSGHGVPAALIMAMAKATVANEMKAEPRIARVFERLNELILVTMKKRRFITVFLAIVDAEGGTLRFGNAGHCRPFLSRKNGEPVELSGRSSFPLGSRKNQEFHEETIELEKGDKLFLFTDGLVETHDRLDNPLGYAALFQTFEKHRNRQPDLIGKAILERVRSFRGNLPPEDDITMIILERKDA